MVHCWVAIEAQGCLKWKWGGSRVESLWYWRWGGSLKDLGGGDGQAVDNPLHSKVGLLEFVGDCSKECLEVGGVRGDGCRGCFESSIRVGVDCCGEGAEFFIKLFF